MLHVSHKFLLVHGIAHLFQAVGKEFYRGKACFVLFQKPDRFNQHSQFQVFFVCPEIIGGKVAKAVFQVNIYVAVLIHYDFLNQNLNIFSA